MCCPCNFIFNYSVDSDATHALCSVMNLYHVGVELDMLDSPLGIYFFLCYLCLQCLGGCRRRAMIVVVLGLLSL